MLDLPTGTVTLLFSDMEGSTRLLQRLGKRYADLLAECRDLLRHLFVQYHGHEVDTQGGAGTNGGIGSSPDGQSHVTVYAEVDDVQKFLERAEALGGKTAVPVMHPTPNLTIGIFLDPQGNMFGLYTQSH